MFDSMVVGRIRFLVVLRTLVLHWLLALSTPGLLKPYPQSSLPHGSWLPAGREDQARRYLSCVQSKIQQTGHWVQRSLLRDSD